MMEEKVYGGSKLSGFVEFIANIRACLLTGDKSRAIEVVSDYADSIKEDVRVVIEYGTPLNSVRELPERLVNALEGAGYITAGSIKDAKEEDLLMIPNLGGVYLSLIAKVMPEFAPKRAEEDYPIVIYRNRRKRPARREG